MALKEKFTFSGSLNEFLDEFLQDEDFKNFYEKEISSEIEAEEGSEETAQDNLIGRYLDEKGYLFKFDNHNNKVYEQTYSVEILSWGESTELIGLTEKQIINLALGEEHDGKKYLNCTIIAKNYKNEVVEKINTTSNFTLFGMKFAPGF